MDAFNLGIANVPVIGSECKNKNIPDGVKVLENFHAAAAAAALCYVMVEGFAALDMSFDLRQKLLKVALPDGRE